MVSKTSDDLPDPDTPVTTTSSFVRMSSERLRRLFWRAPRTRITESRARARASRRCAPSQAPSWRSESSAGADAAVSERVSSIGAGGAGRGPDHKPGAIPPAGWPGGLAGHGARLESGHAFHESRRRGRRFPVTRGGGVAGDARRNGRSPSLLPRAPVLVGVSADRDAP